MINIRNGIFETNSSSAQAFVSVKKRDSDDYFNTWFNKDGVYTVYCWDNIFSRTPFKVLNTLIDKALYALAYYGKEKLREIEDIVRKYCVSYDNRPFNKFKFEDNDYGSIDHQSMGLLDTWLETHNETLEEFLTNPNELIIIDGDEYCVFDSLVDSGLIDKNNILTIVD